MRGFLFYYCVSSMYTELTSVNLGLDIYLGFIEGILKD